MDEMKAVQSLIEAMESLSVDYLVVGSLASSHYGLNRSTEDADLLIRATPEQIAQLRARTTPPWQWAPQTAFDPVTGKTRHLLHLGNSTFKAELFELEENPFDLSRMSRKLLRTAGGRKRFVQSPEDVIVQKLRWYKALKRRKDLDDLHQVILAQNDRLDWDYIHKWTERLGLANTLKQVSELMPE
ncbi:MAG: DUF6036 family nucleotidyltransferase [Phycisphaeraceae bacterium]